MSNLCLKSTYTCDEGGTEENENRPALFNTWMHALNWRWCTRDANSHKSSYMTRTLLKTIYGNQKPWWIYTYFWIHSQMFGSASLFLNFKNLKIYILIKSAEGTPGKGRGLESIKSPPRTRTRTGLVNGNTKVNIRTFLRFIKKMVSRCHLEYTEKVWTLLQCGLFLCRLWLWVPGRERL